MALILWYCFSCTLWVCEYGNIFQSKFLGFSNGSIDCLNYISSDLCVVWQPLCRGIFIFRDEDADPRFSFCIHCSSSKNPFTVGTVNCSWLSCSLLKAGKYDFFYRYIAWLFSICWYVLSMVWVRSKRPLDLCYSSWTISYFCLCKMVLADLR